MVKPGRRTLQHDVARRLQEALRLGFCAPAGGDVVFRHAASTRAAVAAYTPRSPTTGALYQVVRSHLSTFLVRVDERTDGAGLPAFVTREFRKFLGCGVPARGFARLRRPEGGFGRLVPFSCKGRGFCPSCGGRRMTERASSAR